MMGRVMMGTVPLAAVVGGTWNQGVKVANVGGKIQFTGTNGNFFFQGQPVSFSATVFPDSIVANAIYYVTNFTVGGGGVFNIASSYSNALAGTAINYGMTSGTAVAVMAGVSGSQTGENAHTQLLNELFNHTHDPLSPATHFIEAVGGGGGVINPAGAVDSFATTGGITGFVSQKPFNITQSATFYNIYMKL